jgi:hypothetical protein
MTEKFEKIRAWTDRLKGLCHQLNIFFKAYKIKSVLYCHAQMVIKFLACLVLEKNQYEVFACFFENTY